MEVGISELRNSLSRYLAAVRSGRTVTVIERGIAIARITPVVGPTSLEQLRVESRVEPARRRKRPAPDPVRATGTVSDLLTDQRR